MSEVFAYTLAAAFAAAVIFACESLNAGVVAIAAWGAFPFISLGGIAHAKLASSTLANAVFFLGLGVLAAASTFACLFAGTDPQAGLLFVVVPLYELPVVAVVWLVAWLSTPAGA